MLRKVVNETTRVPYSTELSIGALPLNKAEQLAVHTMMAYFDIRYPKEEIPVDIRSISKLTNKKLSNVKRQCAAAAASLPKKAFYRLDPTRKKRPGELFSFEGIPLFRKITFVEESNLLLGIFNEEIIPYLMASPETPIYRLAMLYDFTSQYTSRVFAKIIREYLANNKKSPIFIAKDDMMFSVLGGKKEKGVNYSLFSVGAFNQNVLTPSKKDINNHSKCPIEIEYEEVEDDTGRGGNYATIGWNYFIEEKPGQSIETFMDKIDMTDDLITRGFLRNLAQKVINEFSWNTIRRNIAYFDSNVKRKNLSQDQLGRILYTFIREDEEKKNRKELIITAPAEVAVAMSSLFDEERHEPVDMDSEIIQHLKKTSIGNNIVEKITANTTKKMDNKMSKI